MAFRTFSLERNVSRIKCLKLLLLVSDILQCASTSAIDSMVLRFVPANFEASTLPLAELTTMPSFLSTSCATICSSPGRVISR